GEGRSRLRRRAGDVRGALAGEDRVELRQPDDRRESESEDRGKDQTSNAARTVLLLSDQDGREDEDSRRRGQELALGEAAQEERRGSPSPRRGTPGALPRRGARARAGAGAGAPADRSADRGATG